ncbi:MAG TPA: NADH dehydrogenase (quinone) subunit G [Nitrospiraceae bacterium]|nr:NADH dehydrogenase (quinone) subunit G [Nitrospiraceae bacterium]
MTEQSKLITAVIDGKQVTVAAGTMILKAAESIGITIPVFCYHPRLTISGSCRMCLVEIEGGSKPVTACSTELAAGVVVYTNTPTVLEARREIMENLLINHPLDCPVCDKGGECLLQDHAYDWGPGASRFTERKRLFRKPIPLSDRILLDRERCILCTRCVRFCDEISDHRELAILEMGGNSEIAVAPDRAFDSQFSGNTVELCPVGALTSTSFRFKARPWEMARLPGICPFCGCGCSIDIHTRSGNIMRFMARENPAVDDGWLCDRGRYGFDLSGGSERLTKPLVRKQGRLVAVSWKEAIATAVEKLRRAVSQYGPGAVGGIGSAWSSSEENDLLQRLIRESLESHNVDCSLTDDGRPAALALAEGLGTFTFNDIDRADSILMIGADPSRYQPILDLRLKKAVITRRTPIFTLASTDGEMARYARESLRYRAGSEESLLRLLTAAVKKEKRYDSFESDLRAGGLSREAIDRGLERAGLGPRTVVLVNASLLTDDVRVYLVKELVAAMGAGASTGLLFDSANGFGARTAGAVPGYLPGLRPIDRGMSGPEMVVAAERSTLKALYILNREHHDSAAVARARRGAELLICHALFLDEASGSGDIVFPAASVFEKQGTFTNTAGLAQSTAPVLNPPGEARPESTVIEEIMERLKQ